MIRKSFRIGADFSSFYLDAKFEELSTIANPANSIVITDENVVDAHDRKLKPWTKIVLTPGEAYKVQSTVDLILNELIDSGADRTTTIIGVGGGVVTDITGYVASIFMRGVRFGFVPTTLLGMVDASIGGKNGVDIGPYKNMAGTIRQPDFILHDYRLLASLPNEEWANGFAEIIKMAAIKDRLLFVELENNSLAGYKRKKELLSALIESNAMLKTKIVRRDVGEESDRKLLNFGHTLGHAIEKLYSLSHGEAISIGMSFAATVSQQINGFKESERLQSLLEKYGLPVEFKYDVRKVFDIMQKDKKKQSDFINFILLEKLGNAIIEPISFQKLKGFL